MTKLPSLSYVRIEAALHRLGFVTLRQRGSHIRLRRDLPDGRIQYLTLPAHKPVATGTLARLLKDAEITPDEFESAL